MTFAKYHILNTMTITLSLYIVYPGQLGHIEHCQIKNYCLGKTIPDWVKRGYDFKTHEKLILYHIRVLPN